LKTPILFRPGRVLLQQRHKFGRALNKLLSRRNIGLPHHFLLKQRAYKTYCRESHLLACSRILLVADKLTAPIRVLVLPSLGCRQRFRTE
jgi:hypothetical protein